MNADDTSRRALLHERARSFIERAAVGMPTNESFDALGLEIARYQSEHVAPYRRLLAARRCDIGSAGALGDLPAMPADAFRVVRVAAHSERHDVAVFVTSGTTAAKRGMHALSTTETYERAALAWGGWALAPDAPSEAVAIVLAERSGRDSSLEFMLRLFAGRFAEEAHFAIRQAEIDMEALRGACAAALRKGGPAIVMGTSLAFVHLLDRLAGRRLELPRGSRIMHTGGFKGRSRSVAPAELVAALAQACGVDERAVVGEYGMTELCSQAYEGTLRAMMGMPTPADRHGVFVPPPWMRVVAVDGETLAPVREGEAGLLRIEDLANVDSAVAVQTADVGRIVGGCVALTGRAPGAPPRGCSLAMDDLLSESGE